MSYQFTISEIGLRLIKAYEGFWPQARALSGGGHVVGFGHRLGEDEADTLSEDEAETVLKADLLPIEDLINARIHASMTQSQFDALCSFVFSIGEEAFLASNMIHAMNQGKVLEAANEFDVWRKGNIEGHVYVVDALVRRRTAEKALFLRPTQRIARAPRFELVPMKDDSAPKITQRIAVPLAPVQTQVQTKHEVEVEAESEAEVQEENDTSDIASQIKAELETPAEQDVFVPMTDPESDAMQREIETLEAELSQYRESIRRELAAPPAAVLYSDDVIEDAIASDDAKSSVSDFETELADKVDNTAQDYLADDELKLTADLAVNDSSETAIVEPEDVSPIAQAAAEVSERLDALIEDKPKEDVKADTGDDLWPESLMKAAPEKKEAETAPIKKEGEVDLIIDELQQDDALRQQIVREGQYNVDRYDEKIEVARVDGASNPLIFVGMIITGLIIAAVGLIVNMRGSAALLGEQGPFLVVAAWFIGLLLLCAGGWHLMKNLLARD